MFSYISLDSTKLNAAAFGVIALLNLNMVLCKMSTEYITNDMEAKEGRVEVKIEFILSYISDNEITDDK